MSTDTPHPFPSIEWMTAYAALVADHERAADIAASLSGRYRFVVNPGGGLGTAQSYDLVVHADGPVFTAVASDDSVASLVVTADYPRWRGLLTGRADFVMSYLMRKVRVEGDVGAIRSRLSDARPLLDCLKRVPTTFPY